MRLANREQDKLLISQLGYLAQKRLARGLKLNRTEAIALISHQLHERIRDGTHSVAILMQHGKEILGKRHVLPDAVTCIESIQVEGTFHDGVFLVTVHDPICSLDGNLENAFYGSFLPIPSQDLFPLGDPALYSRTAAPGAVILSKSPIVINKGRKRVRLRVRNDGDRPVQIGSHYHFIETNRMLCFDRALAYGMRLDIPSGTAVRFEPGDIKTVTLCSIAGNKVIRGGNGHASSFRPNPSPSTGNGNGNSNIHSDAESPLSPLLLESHENGNEPNRDEIVNKFVQEGFSHIPDLNPIAIVEDTVVDRATYVGMFGPTTGDRVKLGDTGLIIQVEDDKTVYGDECKFGGGKTIRDGMGQMTSPAPNALDLVITNALIIDHSGIIKADIGVLDGKIKAIGKAGNPDVQDGVTPGLTIGNKTEVIAGEHMIVTAGGVDAHVHYICPQQIWEAISSGVTTFIGGGTGPSAGTNATTCTPSPFYLRQMFTAVDTMPGNFLFTGKGNDSGYEALEDIVKAGAGGLKLHEDWGSTPAAIRTCLDVGDKYDVQVNIHTDTLNESGFVQDTIDAFGGRTIHTYHSEGAGGGHAPDIIVVCGQDNVLPSSTNPTRPYAKNTLDEHLDMLMVCHHLSRTIPEDLSFAESRIRGQTVAAEDVLHDLGAISIISSDSQAMGRIGEVISRTWRTASKMRSVTGVLSELGDYSEGKNGNDNGRVKRYISKYTINPALTHGISHVVGQIKPGTLADLVLWKFENFGSKPELVLKGGVIICAQMGDANASIPTVQPVLPRPMWGSHPSSASLNSVHFVSSISIESEIFQSYGLKKRGVAVKGCRSVRKCDMKWNYYTPRISVDPESYIVRVKARSGGDENVGGTGDRNENENENKEIEEGEREDGMIVTVEPAEVVPLSRSYNIY